MEWIDEYQKLVNRMNTPRVVIDNGISTTATLVKVDSARKHGVLLEAVQALTDLNLSINKAYISSDGRWFMDVFHVTDRHGCKLNDNSVQAFIENAIGAGEAGDAPPAAAPVTALELTGNDRPGLLSDIFAVLSDQRCRVVDAKVWTHNSRIASLIFIADEETGSPICGADRIHGIEARLRNVVKGDADDSDADWPAMSSPALNKIERAHQMYRDGLHREALGLYTEALALSKTKLQKIALHSNRAACYLKLHDFKKAAEECTSVLELDHQHTGALMLRAQTLVTLKDYQSALFDVNRLMELNPSSDVYRNLQARLRTQLSLAPIPESEEESYAEDDDEQNTLADHDRRKGLPSTMNEVTLVDKKKEPLPINPQSSTTKILEPFNNSHPNGRETIPKPKGHSALDYSRWDSVQDGSSEDDDDEEEEQQPQYRFRVRTVGVRPVK